MSLDLNLIYSDFNFTMDKSSRHKIYEFEKFRLDTAHLMLYRGAEEISLVPKAVETLLVLVERRGEIVHKDELMETIWTDSIVEESNLAKYLHVLRKTLGNQQNGKPFIETFRRRGYRFNGEVKVGFSAEIKQKNTIQNVVPLPAPTNSGAIREATTGKIVALADWQHEMEADAKTSPTDLPADQTAEYSTRKIKSRQLGFAVGLIFLLLASIGFGYYFWSVRKTTSSADGKKSLAVLPFVNASQDANAEYLSDGITESIINNLSQLSGLKVMSRNSAFRFKDNQTDTRNIASQLGVENLVTGDIRQIGDRLVINVRLIDGKDDSQIWGNQYVRTLSDVVTLQNEIARDVSLKLGARLSGADERQLAKKYTENPEAYQLFLKGRYYLLKYTPQSIEKSGDYFQQAIALDPNFALAYAFLAAFYGYRNEPLKAKETALKAISLDDQLPTAHDALGGILQRFDYDYVGAEREFKRALELDPNDASTRESYGLMLSNLGRHEEALAEFRLAAEIDPLLSGLNTSYGKVLFKARRYDEAIEQYKKSLELDAHYTWAHYGLAIVYQMKENYAESVEEHAKVAEIADNPQGAAFIRESFANGGWQGFLREMTDNSQAPKVSPFDLATFYAELGEKDKAFAILNKLYEDHDFLGSIKVDPRFDSLHDDPRFQDLLRRVGLPQ